MGSGSNRNPEGGFSIYEWDEEPDLIAGVKVLYNTNNKRSNDLPAYSDTSTMYFKRDANGEIIQLRIYDPITHEAKYDIDINPKKAIKTRMERLLMLVSRIFTNGDLTKKENLLEERGLDC